MCKLILFANPKTNYEHFINKKWDERKHLFVSKSNFIEAAINDWEKLTDQKRLKFQANKERTTSLERKEYLYQLFCKTLNQIFQLAFLKHQISQMISQLYSQWQSLHIAGMNFVNLKYRTRKEECSIKIPSWKLPWKYEAL